MNLNSQFDQINKFDIALKNYIFKNENSEAKKFFEGVVEEDRKFYEVPIKHNWGFPEQQEWCSRRSKWASSDFGAEEKNVVGFFEELLRPENVREAHQFM